MVKCKNINSNNSNSDSMNQSGNKIVPFKAVKKIKRDISEKYTFEETVLGVGHFSKVVLGTNVND